MASTPISRVTLPVWGDVVGLWEPILDRGVWNRVRFILSDPSRRTNPVARGRRHLLSGIAKCGVCGNAIRVGKGKAYKAVGSTPEQAGVSKPVYRCKVASCVTRDQVRLDEFVIGLVCERLARPDAVDLLRRDEPASSVAARAEVEMLLSRLEVAAADYADDTITRDQLHTITARVRPQIEAAKRRVPPPQPSVEVLSSLVGTKAAFRSRWDELGIDARRQVVALLMSVTVNVTRRGYGAFDPDAVSIDWLTTAPE